MKTRTVTPAEFERCVARFAKVAPQKHDAAEKTGIPVAASEMIAAKEITTPWVRPGRAPRWAAAPRPGA